MLVLDRPDALCCFPVEDLIEEIKKAGPFTLSIFLLP